MFAFPMATPKPPNGWEHVRAWLLDLDDGGRRYVAAWLHKWVEPSGKLSGLARHREHAQHLGPQGTGPRGADRDRDPG